MLVIPEVPVLQPRHVASDCRVFADRVQMLEELPQRVPVAELGTFEGLFAELIHKICKPSELHLFDIDVGPLDRVRPHMLELATVHVGRSAENLARFPDGYFGWIYVDGDHSFEGVRDDVAVAPSKLAPDGLLIFNDYTLWSIQQDMAYGVVQNVNRLCVEEGFEVCGFAFQHHGYHDIALRRRTSW